MRRCSVCSSEKRGEADTMLVRGESYQTVAERIGTSKTTVSRHAKEHVSAHLVKAAEARDVLSAGSVLSRLAPLQQAAQEILDDARRKGDHNLALQAISKASSLLQVQGAAIQAARGVATPAETSSVEDALEEIRRRREARRAIQTTALDAPEGPPETEREQAEDHGR